MRLRTDASEPLVPFSSGTQGRGIVSTPPGATVTAATVEEPRVTVISAGSPCGLVTTTAKSNSCPTPEFSTDVGQYSQPM